jgi:DNA-directed RNA polymerase
MTLLTQAEVENQMYYGGVKRALASIKNAEETGNADRNPYAAAIMRDYVLPLAHSLETTMTLGRAQAHRRQTHVNLLAALDPHAVAYLACRGALVNLLREGVVPLRKMASFIGKTIHSELILEQIAENAPELYHALHQDLGRRRSKDERHRMTVFKMQAAKNNIEVVEWPNGARDVVGVYLLGLLEVLGMVDIRKQHIKNKVVQDVMLTDDLMSRIDKIRSFVAISMPTYGPCVEPPRDWVTPIDGGYHTKELIRNNPMLIRGASAAQEINRSNPMPAVLSAVNALQRTAWKVNTRVLGVAREVGKFKNEGEIVSLMNMPAPERPSDIPRDATRETLGPDQQVRFKKWKRLMAEFYTEKKLMATKYARFYSATRAADMFADYPAIYFVYFADFRGRLYPMTYGLNPQGSDLQRALLTFSKGLPLNDEVATQWFMVHGANKWGFDKAPLKERAAWVRDNHQLLMDMAADPVANQRWVEADKPLQFLAWVLEYAEYRTNPATFLSYLPVSMDGSCNGLQNLSALLRDEVGGEATNLVPGPVMQDIYKRVAQVAEGILRETPQERPERERLRLLWLQHGVDRAVVKRAVMTTPYGVTRPSATKYVISDYLAAGKAPVFDRKEYRDAAEVLMSAVWPAIGKVIVKGRVAMDWLKASAKAICKANPMLETIQWVSPSGFIASQSYNAQEVKRVRTHLHGVVALVVMNDKDEPDPNKHSTGLAPNFVHSMDAAHLHLTTTASAGRGIDALAMIHDDYGTHAANAQILYEEIRIQFVSMYEENDPVQDLAIIYPEIPAPPERGALDIRRVVDSEFFFS